jgi:hypothetical protein
MKTKKYKIMDHPGLMKEPLTQLHPGEDFLRINIFKSHYPQFERAFFRACGEFSFHFNMEELSGSTTYTFYCRNDLFAFRLGIYYGQELKQ